MVVDPVDYLLWWLSFQSHIERDIGQIAAIADIVAVSRDEEPDAYGRQLILMWKGDVKAAEEFLTSNPHLKNWTIMDAISHVRRKERLDKLSQIHVTVPKKLNRLATIINQPRRTVDVGHNDAK